MELSNEIQQKRVHLKNCGGTYILKHKVNEKHFWVHIDKQHAIWFDDKEGSWKVGQLKDLGTDVCYFSTPKSSVKAEYPYDNRLSWIYYVGRDKGWKSALTNDVRLTYGGK